MNKTPLKIVLVYPPTEHGVQSYAPQVKASKEGIGFKPPLGLLYIGTYLKDKLGDAVEIKIVDCPTERLTISGCAESIVNDKPDIVGISSWSDFWYPAFTVGKKIKDRLPRCFIVYGGPHAAIYPEITLNVPHADAVIVGDGEIPFYKLVNKILARKNNYSSGEGLHFKKSGINHKSLFYIETNLDSLPIPDRSLLDIRKYNSVLSKKEYSSTMITSRGCPYNCNFCKLYFQKPVCLSAEKVVEEFNYLANLGIREVEVYDDTFTWSHDRARKICEGIIAKNIKIKWSIRDRANSFDRELLDLFKKAGCVRVSYGVESGVDRILKIMKKGILLSQVEDAVRCAKRLGFEVLAFYMFGNLGETIEDMNETIDFATGLPSDYASFGITIPYPGTSLYETALKEGIISHDYWREFAVRPIPDFILPQVIENICSKEDLLRMQKKAMKKFYFRPKYISQQMKKISSLGELVRKSKMAYGVFLNYR